MRITGGMARGTRLLCPTRHHLRPTTDALRQAIFSALGAAVAGSTFVDLFAGTGSYGLEAVSRGAALGDFVEISPSAVATIRSNLDQVAKGSTIMAAADFSIHRADALHWCKNFAAIDLFFFDPPYEMLPLPAAPCRKLINRIAASMHPSAQLVVEWPHGLDFDPPPPLQILHTVGRRRGRGSPTAHILGHSSTYHAMPGAKSIPIMGKDALRHNSNP
ncbi:MAG: RsmD family RNA methyltransferase [Puniceicoccales bacterium]|nr:RsmD family RNA methyltransferase [Puniceicoccales bacterium]